MRNKLSYAVNSRDAPIIGRLRRYRPIIIYTLVVFDGVKTSRMLSCQAVNIGRDVRVVASLAWGGVHGGW